MIYGFTGTQDGMTQKQMLTLMLFLQHSSFTLHHGDCIGADDQAHHVAKKVLGQRTVCHPPLNPRKRAFTSPNDEMRPEDDYIPRNHDIVDESQELLATPKEDRREEQQSGTWATIRYALKKNKTVRIIWPDGDMDTFTSLKSLRDTMQEHRNSQC